MPEQEQRGYDSRKTWSSFYRDRKEYFLFPSEFVVRIFLGKYPRLNLDKSTYKRSKACDIGCGDGRNIVLLDAVGLQAYGTEISEEICQTVRDNLRTRPIPVNADVRVGSNSSLPFESNFFDYALAWNSSYYMMGGQALFSDYVAEYARVLKDEGTLVLSIPMKSNFVYQGSLEMAKGYRQIQNDPFGVRNGEVLRVFDSEDEIHETFGTHFKDLVFATMADDCFGLANHFFIVVCKKKA